MTVAMHETIAAHVLAHVAPMLGDLIEQEVARRVPPKTPAQIRMESADAEIMKVARAVGIATDKLAQARFSGSDEIRARRDVLKATDRLRAVMRKHGRLP